MVPIEHPLGEGAREEQTLARRRPHAPKDLLDLVRMLPSVLAMRPHFIEKLWGGARIESLPAKKREGHAPARGTRVGEAWEVADLPQGCSAVHGGPLDGTS